MIPLYASVVMIGYSMLFPPRGKPTSTTSTLSATSSLSNNALLTSLQSNMFVAGAAFGIGMYCIIEKELKRRRILERFRIMFHSWFWETNLNPIEIPTDLLDLIEQESKLTSNGISKVLLSPNTCLTPDMQVMTLQLPVGMTLDSQCAGGVEFYYVLEGTGMLIIVVPNNNNNNQANDDNNNVVQGTKENYIEAVVVGGAQTDRAPKSFALSKGKCFVVNEGRARQIVNQGREPLVLLRVTDAAGLYAGPKYNYAIKTTKSSRSMGERSWRQIKSIFKSVTWRR